MRYTTLLYYYVINIMTKKIINYDLKYLIIRKLAEKLNEMDDNGVNINNFNRLKIIINVKKIKDTYLNPIIRMTD